MPGGAPSFLKWVRQDTSTNAGAPQSQVILLLFRAMQWVERWGPSGALRAIARKLYVLVTYWFFHVELPPEIEVGPRLRLFHPYVIVLNPGVRLGADCVLRQMVTLGNKVVGDDSTSPVLGDRVELGAGAIVIGRITIGDDAVIGAGAVVVDDVPAGATVAGNPARPLRPSVH